MRIRQTLGRRTNPFGIVALTLAFSALGQAPSSVWDGVYTDDQAQKGQGLYKQHCASCHGDNLDGEAQTDRAKKLNRAFPPLAGDVFTGNWNGRPLSDLYDKVVKTMPWDDPGKISREDNSAIVAYLLKMNRFPPGSKEMPANSDVLGDITIYAVKPK